MAARTVVPCPWCESSSAKLILSGADRFTAESGFIIAECTVCSLRFTQVRPSEEDLGRFYPPEFYDSLSPAGAMARPAPGAARRRLVLHAGFGYPLRGVGMVRRGAARLATRVTRRDASHVPWIPHGRLLEIGSGRGAVLEEYRELGWEVVGVEPGVRGVELARSAGLDVRQGDLRAQIFPSHSFDAVILNHVLEHVPDPRATLLEVWRILRPGGWLLIRLPNSLSWEAALFRSHWYAWELPRHLTHFSPRTLRMALSATGYATPRIRTEFRPATLGLNVRWALESRFGRRIDARLAGAVLAPLEAIAAWFGRGGNLAALGRRPLPDEFPGRSGGK